MMLFEKKPPAVAVPPIAVAAVRVGSPGSPGWDFADEEEDEATRLMTERVVETAWMAAEAAGDAAGASCASASSAALPSLPRARGWMTLSAPLVTSVAVRLPLSTGARCSRAGSSRTRRTHLVFH